MSFTYLLFIIRRIYNNAGISQKISVRRECIVRFSRYVEPDFRDNRPQVALCNSDVRFLLMWTMICWYDEVGEIIRCGGKPSQPEVDIALHG